MSKLFIIILALHAHSLDEFPQAAPQKHMAQSSCSTAKVVLDQQRIKDFAKWELENIGITYQVKNKRVYVDLQSIAQEKRVPWLFTNNDALRFDDSAVAITCMHSIPNIGLFEIGNVKSSKTLAEIKTILTLQNTPLEESYAKYVAISFDSGNNIDIRTTTVYDPTKHYYPMALFFAIGRGNSRPDSTQFTFYKAKLANVPVIVIEVTGAPKRYYDFAQYPLKL